MFSERAQEPIESRAGARRRNGLYWIYNLGNGAGFSVKEIAGSASEVTGRKIKSIEAPRGAGDPAVLVASSRKIREELGWVPKKPELDVMIFDAGSGCGPIRTATL